MDKSIMDRYHTGYIASNAKKIADLYVIPAGAEVAAAFNIRFDADYSSPVWKVAAYDKDERIDIFYETYGRGFKYPVYNHVPEDMYEIALKDIKKTLKRADKAA